jgi:hypothetical protein
VSTSDPEKLLGRRELLKLPLVAAAYGLLPRSATALPAPSGAPFDEADPEGTKIAIKLTVQQNPDDPAISPMNGVAPVPAWLS